MRAADRNQARLGIRSIPIRTDQVLPAPKAGGRYETRTQRRQGFVAADPSRVLRDGSDRPCVADEARARPAHAGGREFCRKMFIK
jgi:hypothetical protein